MATPPYSATSGTPVSGSDRSWAAVSETYSSTFFNPRAMKMTETTMGKCR